jgi:hypothetical protein
MDRQAILVSLHVDVHTCSSMQGNSQTSVAELQCFRVVLSHFAAVAISQGQQTSN